jgi:hypothetical protein
MHSTSIIELFLTEILVSPPHLVLEFYAEISNWLRLISLKVRVYSDNLMLERWIL